MGLTGAARVEPGALAILGAAVLWGSIGVLSVGLFRMGISPWEVAFWRAALSAAALGGYLLLFRRGPLRLESPRDAALLGGFGLVGVGLFYVSFQLATFLTSVAVAVVLLYTAPVFVLLGARLLLGEPLSGAKLGMAGVVVVGVAATSLGAAEAEVRLGAGGVMWGVVAALSYSAYYLFGRRFLPRYGVPRTLFYSLLTGTVALGVASAAAGALPRATMPAAAWLLLLALALGATLLANSLYYWGLGGIEAGRAAVIASVEPVIAALLALLVFDQRLTGVGWAGVGLVVAGVAVSPWVGRRRAHGLHAGQQPDAAAPQPEAL